MRGAWQGGEGERVERGEREVRVVWQGGRGVAGRERGLKNCLTDWLHPRHQETAVQRSRDPAIGTVFRVWGLGSYRGPETLQLVRCLGFGV
jgi:hypothetical protein